MYLKAFDLWLSESTSWADEKFATYSEKEVADVAEQELLTKELVIIEEGEPLHDKFIQLSSTDQGENVLEVHGNELTMFSTPVNFLKWNRLGSDNKPIETRFIVKSIDTDRI